MICFLILTIPSFFGLLRVNYNGAKEIILELQVHGSYLSTISAAYSSQLILGGMQHGYGKQQTTMTCSEGIVGKALIGEPMDGENM
jgi:hypothetical protein